MQGKGQGQGRGVSYEPSVYLPLDISDYEAAEIARSPPPVTPRRIKDDGLQWSSGICACCDDMQSCCIGLFCPCFLFGKSSEVLGSGNWLGSCMTHFVLWGLVNSICCMLTDGIPLGLPGTVVACYACGYRRAMRRKFNLQEAPCSDLATHFFCHLCAICQEYREIRERSGGSGAPDFDFSVSTAPPAQVMESAQS